jgi:hypothetical protein
MAYLQYHWLSREKFSDGRKYNVGNISILSMVIGAGQEIVYYHKLLKILESYSIYPKSHY